LVLLILEFWGRSAKKEDNKRDLEKPSDTQLENKREKQSDMIYRYIIATFESTMDKIFAE